MNSQTLLEKNHRFHDAIVKKITIINPNIIDKSGATSVNPIFNIQIDLQHFVDHKTLNFSMNCINVHKFKFNKEETYSYLIFGIEIEDQGKLKKIIIDDFDEILCEDITIEEIS
jgi:hypothetical protein